MTEVRRSKNHWLAINFSPRMIKDRSSGGQGFTSQMARVLESEGDLGNARVKRQLLRIRKPALRTARKASVKVNGNERGIIYR